MNTPVIIGARNESDSIGRTLASLPRTVEPIVVPNGCTDNTALIAEAYGATIVTCESSGLLPAQQHGLRYLGSRATEPVLIIDADCVPLMPGQWARVMVGKLNKLSSDTPSMVIGGNIFTGDVLAIPRTARHLKRQFEHNRSPTLGSFRGSNMMIRLFNQRVLDAVLELPNYWPGCDEAIKDAIVDHAGSTFKTVDPRALIITETPRCSGLLRRLRQGKLCAAMSHDQTYLDDAPIGSLPYPRWSGITYKLPQPNLTDA